MLLPDWTKLLCFFLFDLVFFALGQTGTTCRRQNTLTEVSDTSIQHHLTTKDYVLKNPKRLEGTL